MRTTVTKSMYRQDFDSLPELAELAPQLCEDYADRFDTKREFTGRIDGMGALKLARDGWAKHSDETLTLADTAVTTVEASHTLPAFLPVFDVTGCEVDVARFLDGEPECMIDYPLTEIVKAGRVITLCASVSFSGSLKSETIIRRGRAVTALALALARCGYACEIIADMTCSGANGRLYSMRTVVKSAHDETDPARILFGLAHPAMLRILGFAAQHGMPDDWQEWLRVPNSRGTPVNPVEDLAEGTIYLPAIRSDRDVPDAHVALLDYLRQLEIVA